MARPRRIDRIGGWYHLMNRGAARLPTFLDDADRVEFGRLLGVVHERFGVVTHAYCLMTNHYHLVVECPTGGVSSAMRDLGSVFTRHFNERHRRDGPLFRGRFHSIDIETDAHLLCAVRYVHRNALDIAGVTAVDHYRWSSHRTYLGHRVAPRWLRTSTVLDQFDDDADRFHRFVANDQRPAAVHRNAGAYDDALIETAVTEVVMRSERGDGEGAAGPHLVQTVKILLLEEDRWSGRAALAARLGDISRFARRRAHERCSRDPLAARALESATSVLIGAECAECA